MHTVDWSRLRAVWEELLTSDCTSNNVADQRVTLRQIRREIHFLPKGEILVNILSQS